MQSAEDLAQVGLLVLSNIVGMKTGPVTEDLATLGRSSIVRGVYACNTVHFNKPRCAV